MRNGIKKRLPAKYICIPKYICMPLMTRLNQPMGIKKPFPAKCLRTTADSLKSANGDKPRVL